MVQQGPQQPEPEPETEVEEEAPEPPGIAEVQPPTSAAEVYEGTVKLRVNATDAHRQVIQFVEELRQNSAFRLLKLVGGYEVGVDIWLGLRAPLSVKEVLLGMKGVSEVEPADQLDQNLSTPLIHVRLAQIPSPA